MVWRRQRGSGWNTALLSFTGEGARRADEGARAQRSAAFDFGGWQGEESKSSSLRSRPHPALRDTFSRFAGEGLGLLDFQVRGQRSEERRVGKEGVRTCRSRWSPYQ